MKLRLYVLVQSMFMSAYYNTTQYYTVLAFITSAWSTTRAESEAWAVARVEDGVVALREGRNEIIYTTIKIVRLSVTVGVADWAWSTLTSLNVFVPNSQERHVRSKVIITRDKKRAVHCHHPPRQRRNGLFCCMTHCSMLAANNIIQQQTGPFRRCRVISVPCVQFTFGKTSLALVVCFVP